MRNPILAAVVLVLTLVILRSAHPDVAPQAAESTCDSPSAAQVETRAAPLVIGMCRE